MHTPAQQQCPNPQLSRLQAQQSDAPCENTLDSGHTKQRAQLIQWSAWLCSLVRYVHVHLFYRSRSLQPLNRTRPPGTHHVRFPAAPAADSLAAWKGERSMFPTLADWMLDIHHVRFPAAPAADSLAAWKGE